MKIKQKAFSLIELIVVMAILAILVMIAVPHFFGNTSEARLTKLMHDARLLTDACERYYMDTGEWPRLSDQHYSAEEVQSWSDKIYSHTKKEVTLDPDGKYYDIDFKKLANYVTVNSDPENFILQNPVGDVYVLDPQTNTRLSSSPVKENQKPIAVITMTPEQGLTTTTTIVWDYSASYDPDGDAIVNAEWQGKQDIYDTEGEYTVQLRVQDEHGLWSDWVSKTFYVVNMEKVTQIAIGEYHTVALMNDGTVMAWGDNRYGQLGTTTNNGTGNPILMPTKIPGLTGVKQIAAGDDHTVALMNDGTVMAWGANDWGQLGTTTDNDINPTPIKIPGLSGVKQIAAGGYHTVALMNDGTVMAWGSNRYGQLGTTTNSGERDPNPTPTKIPGLSGVKQIAAGYSHTVALMNDGTVMAWGSNYHGELGTTINNDTINPNPEPTEIPGLTGVKQIAAGASHTVALMNDGTVMAWGYNDSGQLGTTTDNKINPDPIKIPGLSGVKQIAAGFDHTVALMNDGTVMAWGYNRYGQLGTKTNNGTDNPNPMPTEIPGLTGVEQIAAGNGGWHTVALLNDGTVMAWGLNSHGQLGNGTINDINPTPIKIPGLSGLNK